MEEHLKRLPKEILDLIYLCREIAEAAGIKIYLIGGFVRDLLLGVKNLDLDIAVEGNGIEFADILAQRLNAKLVKHKRFGTATLNVKPHIKVDIASTRKELYPHPGCLPVVDKGGLKDDLARRDFTINTLAININTKNFGKLIDLFGGKFDIENKRIRILHKFSFIDDPIRILRAIRFEQRYNFKIEPLSFRYLKEALELKMLNLVQPQRVRDEIILTLKEENPLRQIGRIKKLAGFGFISPKLVVSKKTEALFDSVFHQIHWFKTSLISSRQLDTWLIYFMALLDPLAIRDVRLICRKFVFRKGEEKRIFTYMRWRFDILLKLKRNKIKPSDVFHLLNPLSYEVILLIKAGCRNKNVEKHIEDFFRIYQRTTISISGDDLRQMGFAPGPHYQKIFRRVLNAKLNGQLKTEGEELKLVEKFTAKSQPGLRREEGYLLS